MQQLLLDDSQLLDQLRSHDGVAFESLYSKYWKRLFDFARVKTRDTHVAEEIVQDLFVTLWEKRESLQVSNLQSYLFTAVRNKVIDYYKEKVFSELENLESVPAPDYPVFLDELEAAMQAAIFKLPEKTRQIFLLSRFENNTARQISMQLHIPERTVEYHITQALRALRIMLKEYMLSLLALIFLS
jgi:RNA polymerase sigma-70 factor (family 1)